MHHPSGPAETKLRQRGRREVLRANICWQDDEWVGGYVSADKRTRLPQVFVLKEDFVVGKESHLEVRICGPIHLRSGGVENGAWVGG